MPLAIINIFTCISALTRAAASSSLQVVALTLQLTSEACLARLFDSIDPCSSVGSTSSPPGEMAGLGHPAEHGPGNVNRRRDR